MRRADVARLVALGAIWGSSFLFMRVSAPALGPVVMADVRILVAAAALLAYYRIIGFDPQWRRWGMQYAIVGTLNAAVPFVLYAYSALSLSVAVMAVINATSPMWGALVGALWLKERLSRGRALGLAIGVAGVALVSKPAPGEPLELAALLAAVGAAFLYGIAGAYLKRFAPDAPGRGMAVGALSAAGLLLVPFAALSPAPPALTAQAIGAVIALGVLCSAIAYLLYFRLLNDIGVAGTLTVTYLVPLFGVLWGVLFLGESLTATMLAGGGLIVLGTLLVLRN
jgi:drug/metabolite transporter (DMT)-like permease